MLHTVETGKKKRFKLFHNSRVEHEPKHVHRGRTKELQEVALK